MVFLNHHKLWEENASWVPPEHPNVKLNTDGSWRPNTRLMGTGGVIRDCVGRWLFGFANSARTGDPLKAELTAVVEGLSLCWNVGLRNIICETDCGEVIEACESLVSLERWQVYANLVRALKELLSRNWLISIRWIPREINKVAHTLAGWGASSSVDYVVWHKAPTFVLEAVEWDVMSSMDIV
uniref:Ribonuclease H protein At1g65750 family n=1 Tax=Cajanus cajan TaxID=3821 RepID=A0A151RQ15_CAJCA|nr:Putative ribonuclease H protein At1g65750 family [Cajanus cajan]